MIEFQAEECAEVWLPSGSQKGYPQGMHPIRPEETDRVDHMARTQGGREKASA
jgi:hypothetical protein